MKFVNGHFVEYTSSKFLSYDDVLLLPRHSQVKSRNDPRLDLGCGVTESTRLSIPLVSSPMSSVSESKLCAALNKAGGLGILHRFYPTIENRLSEIIQVHNETGKTAFAVGLAAEEIPFIDNVVQRLGKCIVCVDVAHGHLSESLNQVYKISQKFRDKVEIIGGSACTPSAIGDLIKAGSNAIRVGIGNASMCSTRLIAGAGMPQLTAVMKARDTVNALKTNCKIIADGGIRTPGDAVKALAAGADCVMIGNLFAGTEESPGEAHDVNGQKYKRYYGQSSKEALNLINKFDVTPEGESTLVTYKGNLIDTINYMTGGIKSGMSYQGVYNLDTLYENAVFIEITQNGLIESHPHGVYSNNG